jgi:hypothetical protein
MVQRHDRTSLRRTRWWPAGLPAETARRLGTSPITPEADSDGKLQVTADVIHDPAARTTTHDHRSSAAIAEFWHPTDLLGGHRSGRRAGRLGRDADLFIVEATDRAGEILRSEWNLMTSAEAGRWAKPAGARRLMLTHFWPGNDQEVSLAATRAEFDGEVLAAEEELVVALGPA